jgi:hypothetical protein
MAGNSSSGADQLGMPAFDLSALQNVLNVRARLGFDCCPRWSCFWLIILVLIMNAQDPSIKQMAEQIAQDPAFAQMTAALQASLGTGPGDAAVEREGASAEAPEAANIAGMDAEKYAAAMQSVLQNQQFMEMAEKLGQQIMAVRCSTSFLRFGRFS